MDDLKLIALDEADLKIVSSLTQDAIIMPSEIVFDASAKNFILPMRRFAWEKTQNSPTRKSAVLRFTHVLNVQSKGVKSGSNAQALSLLSINTSSLSGQHMISLVFADDASILLNVDALEVELRDLGAAWAASRQPNHGK